ncbi:MAG: hypothetical protein LAN71_16820 [Acidobacteriia bacterium]|nr:hypothetical protein [Terriglobia bacterium]
MGLQDDKNLQREFHKEGLRYTTDVIPGFMRQKNKKDFTYYDVDGKRITDKKVIGRIKNLAIPPAWRDVWICTKENGHLQAVGIDDRGRKQYIYHSEWIKISQENKFGQLADFGISLPIIGTKRV